MGGNWVKSLFFREKFLEDTGIFITFMSSLYLERELVRRVKIKNSILEHILFRVISHWQP